MKVLQDGLIVDLDCRVSPWGHEVHKTGPGAFVCQACGHLAYYHWEFDGWVVLRPFIIEEEPW